jgi:cardiolipin synthase
MKIVSIPNILTLIRIIIIPIFVTALVYKRYDYALYLFAGAAVTDALDGFAARFSGQKTELGAFLDPLADKSLLITSFILFSIYGWIPTWLTIIVISRDIIVVLGWFLIYLVYGRTKVEPSIIGKAAIASQLLLIAYALVDLNTKLLDAPPEAAFWTVAGLTVASGLQYAYRGLKRANEK